MITGAIKSQIDQIWNAFWSGGISNPLEVIEQANQIEFINLIVNHLTEHGVMEAARLYESPFTDLTPHGPEGLFTTSAVDELIAVLNVVRRTAIAA